MPGLMRKIPLMNVLTKIKTPKKLLRPRALIHLFIILIIVYLCYILGLFTHMLEKDLNEFRYPLKIDVRVALQNLYQDSQSLKYLDINNLNYTFIHKAEKTCEPAKLNVNGRRVNGKPYLVILVKSKLTHFEHREAIRKTWGQSDPMKLIRTVFLVGLPSPDEAANPIEAKSVDLESLHQNENIVHSRDDSKSKNTLQDLKKEQHDLFKLEMEYEKYGDIIQQNFLDTYYNNTIKTFMGIRWINEYCSNARFYLFIDDDFYLNPNLLMKYLANNVTESMLSTFYAGYVFGNSSPMRHLLSKWYISLKDYPYHKFPPYVAAGCYILSRQSAHLFYMASKLIELFKFDDIYMGILAHKLDIKPLHLESVYFYAPSYYPSVYAKEVIAAHKFTSDDITRIWAQLEKFIEFKSSSSYF